MAGPARSARPLKASKPSTPSSTPRPRSSASSAPPSTLPANAASTSHRSTKPTSSAHLVSGAAPLRFSLGLKREAAAIEAAVEQIINAGYRTEDVREAGKEVVGTKAMGQLITQALLS